MKEIKVPAIAKYYTQQCFSENYMHWQYRQTNCDWEDIIFNYAIIFGTQKSRNFPNNIQK
jgi:hypothetical protein